MDAGTQGHGDMAVPRGARELATMLTTDAFEIESGLLALARGVAGPGQGLGELVVLARDAAAQAAALAKVLEAEHGRLEIRD